MTWEELVEKAKEFGYHEVHIDGDIPYFNVDSSYRLVDIKNYISFIKDGTIESGCGYVISTDRTYEQMYQIMMALHE